MNNLYEQYGPKLPYGLTQEDIKNPKQAFVNRFGNITSNPLQMAMSLIMNRRFSQSQLNNAINMAGPFINGPK